MAKPRDNEPDPPVESEEESGEEEESSSDGAIEGSESESEPEPPRTQNSQLAKKPAPAPVGKKPEPQPSRTQPADSSSDDGESESETDSDAPTKKPDPNIKPIASKPMDDVQKTPPAKKPRSKLNTSGPTSPTKSTPGAGAKRPSGAAGVSDSEDKDAKRSKKKSETGVESSEKKGNSIDDSKKLFQRLWSEDDEIAILKGMIDYQAKKKADPVADLNAFLEFIKKSLHIDVSKTQLQDKIRRLKKKYENNASKEKKGKENQSVRPPLPTSSGPASHPQHGVSTPGLHGGGTSVGPGLPNSNISSDWLGGGTTGVSIESSLPNRGTSPSMIAASPKPQDPVSVPSLTATRDPQAMPGSGNGFAANSNFGGDTFSATQTLTKQASLAPASIVNTTAVPSAIVSVNAAPESSAKPDPFAALQNTYTRSSAGSQPQQTQSFQKANQQVSSQVTPSFSSSGMPVGGGNSTLEQSQPWPKMTRPGVQKYAKVFMEVDTDRDGKITGEQARNLFLSWRLPREVLKQVWDLSDQDNDSMLSLREFCIALYLMERYREGRSLPSTLPASVMLDETLLALAGPPTASYGNTGWVPTPGLRPQQVLTGTQQIMPAGVRPPMQPVYPQPAGTSLQFNQQNARGPSVENSYVNDLSNGEQNSLDMKDQEAAEAGNKATDKKVILDSKEKLEYYRTKMQDLVLYKSRCDNRLNEITERAIADKHEAELLAKKYEEKYKQVAEIASKLTIEEASFRDIQERKMELHQAILKVEQGGSADGILQVRADRIQSDLEELLKVLTERCKKHGVNVKSAAVIELPPGWQPGIPEIAAVWDEDWDKFEDEGFSFDVAVPAGAKLASQEENSSLTQSLSSDSVSNYDKSEKSFSKDFGNVENESSDAHSEDESKSPHGSPTQRTAFESPTHDYSDNHFEKNSEIDTESHRGFDDANWGTFDNNDDIDSVWGFSAKDSDHEKRGEGYFFGPSEFGGSPVRAGSPQAGSSFQKNSAFSFEDSVPATPLSRPGNSPRGFDSGRGDPFFDSFSRYDSFSTHDRSSSPHRETLARFDSVNSTRSFDHSRGFSFDDSDPFGSSGPFKVSSESQSPRKSSQNWRGF